jgi:ABC-type transporter Mla maintaining outer membrane lipid asymmetry ATPase subunit MlaF
MFRIEKSSKLLLRVPKFLCDKPIHKQFEFLVPNCPFLMAIIGSSGSGKTSMMVNLLTSKLTYINVFHSVHNVMPSHSVASLKKKVLRPTLVCTMN